MVNKVILVGPLTRDAESFVGARGAVTRMRLRTSRSWQDADGASHDATEYHNVVAFDRVGELCAVYGFKGVHLYVEGHLRTREYEGGDGLRRTITEVVAEVVRNLGSGDIASVGAATSANGEPASATAAEG